MITIIIKSRITGKAVWIYRGASRSAARRDYIRAKHKEIERVRAWRHRRNGRKQAIMRFLTECMANIPLTMQLTNEQASAIRQLKSISNEPDECNYDFYEHIIEESRSKNDASQRWRAHRKKVFTAED